MQISRIEYTIFFQLFPFLIVVLLGYIAYNFATAKFHYNQQIKDSFLESIEEIKQLSNQAIKGYFATVTEHTKNTLSQLKNMLLNFREDMQNQLKETEKNTTESLQEMNKNLEVFSKRLQELENIILELQAGARKRDAIIERKTKQIKRLKEKIEASK